MDALEAIRTRHSSRTFTNAPLPPETIEKIVDAGRLAASGKNEQPWAFVAVSDAAGLKAMADLTDFGKFIAQAACCIAVFCRESPYYLEDGSAASQNMLVAAAALGVQSCWVSGDKRPYAAAMGQLLGVPAGYKLVSLLPMGYEASNEPRRPKRALAEVLHWQKFGVATAGNVKR